MKTKLKNNVIKFPFQPPPKTAHIVVPVRLIKEAGQHFTVFEAVGDGLKGDRIQPGDFIICKTKFEMSEIKNNICLVYVHSTGGYFAKRIAIDELHQTVTLKGSNGNDMIYRFDEVKITGIAIGFQVFLSSDVFNAEAVQ